MMANRPTTLKRGGTWTRAAIFITSYILLLESLIEWVLILYLYGNKRVDSKMSPSLALALTASFITVPLLSIHSLLAWKYSKLAGRRIQTNIFHTSCTYVLRANILIWLAASVAGLVVVSQQASCLPDDTDGSYWKVGVSCALHRAVVIVAVVSFITICLYFCSRELCDRPFDVSLLGIYNQPHRSRDGSIRSKTSWDSENTLKNDILYIRRPDATYGGQGRYWPSDDEPNFEKSAEVPNIQQPAPVRSKPQLKLNTKLASEATEVVPGSAISPSGTTAERSIDERSVPSDPVSRTSTVLTSRTSSDNGHSSFIAELPGAPEVPQIPAKYSHQRNKSSLYSLRKLLPKSLPISVPLSADPQIKALSNPNIYFDLEKQAEKAFLSPKPSEPAQNPPSPQKPQPTQSQSSSFDVSKHRSCPNMQTGHTQNQEGRSLTMSSADAPEVVPGQQPQKVQRPDTTQFNPPLLRHSTNHSHYPGSLHSVPSMPVEHSITRPLSTAGVVPTEQQQQQHAERLRRHTSRRYSTIGSRRQSQAFYQFEPSQMPRHLQGQSQYRRPFSHFNYPIRHNIGTVPRRHDVEIIYPSTRRTRSSTYGGISSIAPLDSIKESRASFDEVPGHTASGSGSDDSPGAGRGRIIYENTYRGANWTSMPSSSSG